MSEPADFRVQRAIEMLVVCVREEFTGSLEMHFKRGDVRMARKVEETRFEDSPKQASLAVGEGPR